MVKVMLEVPDQIIDFLKGQWGYSDARVKAHLERGIIEEFGAECKTLDPEDFVSWDELIRKFKLDEVKLLYEDYLKDLC